MTTTILQYQKTNTGSGAEHDYNDVAVVYVVRRSACEYNNNKKRKKKKRRRKRVKRMR